MTKPAVAGTTRRPAGGFTLVELLCALAITAVIGLTVVGVAGALSRAQAAIDGYHDSIQSGRCVMTRMSDTIRRCKLVTAATATSVVLWTGDANGDGQINDDELVEIAYNTATGQVCETRVEYPAGLADATRQALNIGHSLNDVISVTAADTLIKLNVYDVARPLAAQVTSFKVTVSPAPPLTRCVGLEITCGSGDAAFTDRIAVEIRADATADVGQAGGQWVLTGG